MLRITRPRGSLQIDASLPGYRRLLRWAGQFGERRWAVENVRGLGRHLAQWLAVRGEHVVDVPSTATARVRELSRAFPFLLSRFSLKSTPRGPSP
jgi:transposase